LLFWPQQVSNTITPIRDEMLEVLNKNRQYKVQECGVEPRLHTLFASSAPADECGYTYGSISMKSHPSGDLKETSKLAEQLAGTCDVQYLTVEV
jgi:hypothetical protein